MNRNKRIGIVCSSSFECSRIVQQISGKMAAQSGNVQFRAGRYGRKEIVVALSGIGKTNAAHGTTVLIEKYHPSMVFNIGIGGCYPGAGVHVGDVAVAEKEIYADEGVMTLQGLRGMEEAGIPLLKKGRKAFYNDFPGDRQLIQHIKKITASFPLRFGTFLTVSTVTGTLKHARSLRDAYGGICENMEGAAVFHVSHIYGVPCCEIRGISNVVENRNRKAWKIGDAAHAAQSVFLSFVGGL